MILTWSRTNKEGSFVTEKLSPKLVSEAETLLDRCNREDPAKNLLLSKKWKENHKTLVKKNFGVVRGHVIETNVFPLKDELLAMKRNDFAALSQDIHKRRNNTAYETFDQFRKDINSVAFVETVFEQEGQVEGCFFACSCIQAGVKGKICCHVAVAMIEAGIIKKRSSNTPISNFGNKKGAPKKGCI